MKINWKKLINPIIVVVLALVFFVATSSFNYLTQDKNYTKWTSPDETANYFFTKQFGEKQVLSYFDPAAVIGDNLVMPRSLRSDFGWVKPVSFLGIIISYGTIASWLGIDVIPFLTPFFAALGIIFFYFLVSYIFNNKRIGLISSFLLASFPVYIYYSVRSMFHNVLFIVFLIIAAYFLAIALGHKKRKGIWQDLKNKFISFKLEKTRTWQMLWAFLAGIFAGLAVITRTSELLWLAPCAGIIWIFYARRLGLIKFILFFAGLFLALMPVAYWNTVLYQSSFSTGYNEMNRSLQELSTASNEVVKTTFQGQISKYSEYFRVVSHNIFYFGFNKAQSLAMFNHYVIEMFPQLVIVGSIGFLILFIKNIIHFKKKYLVYALVWLTLSVILIFYYGSWSFNDNPDPTHFTIGNSYTRYWLPIYLMLLPLVALAIEKITRIVLLITNKSKAKIRKIIAGGIQALVVLYFVYLGINFVLFGSEEGLAYLYYNNLSERANAEKVWSLTEKEGIIITQYYDKFFFPERRIIMGKLPNDEILTAVEKLVNYYPVYYYNFYLNDKDVAYLNERKFAPYNVKMKLVSKINAKFGLYKIEAIKSYETK